MAAFISKQPNGLYCRFSTVVDTVTHYNMSKEDYLNNVTGTVSSRKDGKEVLEEYLIPFREVINRFAPINMTREEFDEIVDKMCKKVNDNTRWHVTGGRRQIDNKSN